jgi:hypothetical protein
MKRRAQSMGSLPIAPTTGGASKTAPWRSELQERPQPAVLLTQQWRGNAALTPTADADRRAVKSRAVQEEADGAVVSSLQHTRGIEAHGSE